MGVTAMQEVISNAVATGAPLHIVHMNSSSLWSYQTNLDLILGAQERGADITVEAYPYTAASTGIQSAILDDGWQDRLRISYGDIQWQDTGERLTEESFNRYRKEGGTVIMHMMKEEWIRAQLSDPRVMVASDGMPYAPGAHPRSAGTFSRFLGRYVRDQEVVSLMGGLAKISLMPALRLETIAPQMKRKGRLQIGSDADITVFDADTIIDTADFVGELTYSKGVKYVFVNGIPVVWDGQIVEGARPGQPILGRHVVL
jgi:dihydroorotase